MLKEKMGYACLFVRSKMGSGYILSIAMHAEGCLEAFLFHSPIFTLFIYTKKANYAQSSGIHLACTIQSMITLNLNRMKNVDYFSLNLLRIQKIPAIFAHAK